MKIEMDVAKFAAQLKTGKGIGGKDGALTPLIKQLTEMVLQAELETHLSQDLEKNRKNGSSSKTIKSAHGTLLLQLMDFKAFLKLSTQSSLKLKFNFASYIKFVNGIICLTTLNMQNQLERSSTQQILLNLYIASLGL